jgi:hypothetical protein
MKKFQSKTEGSWIELLPVELTEEQKALLISTREEDRGSQKDLRDWIKSQREGEVDELKSNELTAFYEDKKPEVKQGQAYQLISIDLAERTKGVYEGILNCRVNGEHKQIRF